MAVKNVKRARKSKRGEGRVMQTVSISVKPETVELVKVVLAGATISTSAVLEDAIVIALNDPEFLSRYIRNDPPKEVDLRKNYGKDSNEPSA